MASSIFVAGADGFSFGLVLLFLFTLIYLIWLTGSILVYDSLNIGVDATTAGRLRSGLQDFKRKIEENRLHSAPASQSTTAIHCPACGVPVTVDDLFCGRCGHRME
jgi:Na+-transporting methylmalonyl-CoA/oxaloacetate decarboxylase gamma subunit